MTPTLKMDTREFGDAVRVVSRGVKENAVGLINQAAVDIAERSFHRTHPRTDDNPLRVEEKRRVIMDWLKHVIARPTHIARGGKFKGQRKAGRVRLKSDSKKRGHRSYRGNFRRVHLIAQGRAKKAGMKGLYGRTMRIASSKILHATSAGVGYVKSIFIPVVLGLMPYVKYKKRLLRPGSVQIWPGSTGSGHATPATTATSNALAMFRVDIEVDSGQEGKVEGHLNEVVAEAFAWKTERLRRDAEKIIQADFDKVNAKTTLGTVSSIYS